MLKIVDDRYGGGWDIKEDLPEGWKILVDEMETELREAGLVESTRFIEVKEKYCQLRCYITGEDKAFDIIRKYEDKSTEICMFCGKPKSTRESFCAECAKKIKERKSLWED